MAPDLAIGIDEADPMIPRRQGRLHQGNLEPRGLGRPEAAWRSIDHDVLVVAAAAIRPVREDAMLEEPFVSSGGDRKEQNSVVHWITGATGRRGRLSRCEMNTSIREPDGRAPRRQGVVASGDGEAMNTIPPLLHSGAPRL
jgi:hypothetical protein